MRICYVSEIYDPDMRMENAGRGIPLWPPTWSINSVITNEPFTDETFSTEEAAEIRCAEINRGHDDSLDDAFDEMITAD